MQKVIAVTLTVAACWLASGCTPGSQAPRPALDPSATIAERTALDSARDWSKKYALLADSHMKLQQTSQKTTDEKRDITAKLAKADQDLAQARKELQDANAMLGELNKELAQWKRDVLGFREELRRSEKVQIGLMSRIVVLLGGEAPEIKVSAREAGRMTTGEITGG